MTFVTMSFAVLGFLSPANRGGLMTAMLLLFVLMGLFAGYYSARLFKMFQLTEWKARAAPWLRHPPPVRLLLFPCCISPVCMPSSFVHSCMACLLTALRMLRLSGCAAHCVPAAGCSAEAALALWKHAAAARAVGRCCCIWRMHLPLLRRPTPLTRLADVRLT